MDTAGSTCAAVQSRLCPTIGTVTNNMKVVQNSRHARTHVRPSFASRHFLECDAPCELCATNCQCTLKRNDLLSVRTCYAIVCLKTALYYCHLQDVTNASLFNYYSVSCPTSRKANFNRHGPR
eukprot:1343937-Amphidinium_carterae.1